MKTGNISHSSNFNQKKGLQKGQRVALLSVLVIFFLALLKMAVGHRFHSSLLIADAWHSGADILINFTSLLGLWLASWKKTSRFPFGLYRAETMACLIMGAVIILIGLELFHEGFSKLFYLQAVGAFPVFPVGAGLISAAAAFFLGGRQKKVGIEIQSQALLTTSRESFFDVFTSIVVVAGIILAHFKVPYVEGGIIILISILIFKLGVETIGVSLLILLDANLDTDLQTGIEETIRQVYGVKRIGEVKIRRAGPFKMVDCIIETSPLLPLYKAHEMADQIETKLYAEYDRIETVFIHIEPKTGKKVSAIMPVQHIDGLNSKLHGHFARAPYFIILTLDDGQAEIDDFYINQYLDDTTHIGLKVVKTIVQYHLDLLFAPRIGEISFHMLKNSCVDIYQAEKGRSVGEILDLFRAGKLRLITEPTHGIEQSHGLTVAG